MGIIDTVKEHPYISASVALGAIVLVVIFAGLGGDEPATISTPSPVETGNEMYAIDRQAQTQIALAGLQLEALEMQGANELAIRNLEAVSYNKTIELQSQIQSQGIEAQQQMHALQSNLVAQLQTFQAQTAKDIALATTNAQLDMERIRSAENIATLNAMAAQTRDNAVLTADLYRSSMALTADAYRSALAYQGRAMTPLG